MSRSANRIAFLSAIWLLVVAVAPAAAATPRAATSAAPGTDFVLPLPPPPVVLTPFTPPQKR